MKQSTRICKICGCGYPYCKTFSSNFRYQDVACSPEHAAEYFKRIDLARAIPSANADAETLTRMDVFVENDDVFDDEDEEDNEEDEDD